MSIPFRRATFAALAASLLTTAPSAHELFCAGGMRGLHAAGAPVDSPVFRKYAPERFVDVLHMRIEVTPDFGARSVAGRTTIRFKPIVAGQKELRLNAHDLRVRSWEAAVPVTHLENTGRELVLTFGKELPEGIEQEVTIVHEAFPDKGFYFRTKEMGYLPEDEHVFTQGEDVEARHWFPCYDAPNDKFTDDLICHVPEGMTVISNGRLVSEQPEGNGRKAVHWRQEKPHASYLISLVAGYFKKVEDRYQDLPIAFYTPSSQIGLAENSFAQTKEMLEFFEREIGVPYPWAKYDQVCVQDFMWGGMENTSATTLTDNTLFPEETENIRTSQGLVAHELAHQWFGDLVTCEDWSQIWLNEGFATYYAHLYQEHKNGRDDFLYGLYGSAGAVLGHSAAEDTRPIVFREYDTPLELFGYLVYPKGGWVLHMLRSELGEDLYRRCIRTYLERHQFANVETHDLIEIVEELSGRSWDQFFDQWVFHPHFPELSIQHEWDQSRQAAKITVAQRQPLTNGVALFRFPLKLRFKGAFGTIDKTLEIKEKEESFYLELPDAPKIVRADPDYQLLAKIDFEPGRELAVAQLKDESDVMGRIFALLQLSKAKDQATIDLIAERLQGDPFYGVRVEAAEALGKIQSKEALRALIAAADQPDARVRQAVVQQATRYFEPEAREFALAVLKSERNPEIRQTAVRSLDRYPSNGTYETILREIQSESYQNMVASSAIAAARAQNDPRYLVPIIERLKRNPVSFSAGRFAAGLEAVAYLGRHEKNKDLAYATILEQVNGPRRSVRTGAIRALGILRDERALPLLEQLAAGEKGARETLDAKRALEAIRPEQPVVTELNTLRGEVLDLKHQNEEFQKSLEDLKKQMAPAGAKEPEKKGGKKRRKVGK